MGFDLVKGGRAACIVLSKSEGKGVYQAAMDLQRDITKITGYTPNIVHSLDAAWGKCVVAGSADSWIVYDAIGAYNRASKERGDANRM